MKLFRRLAIFVFICAAVLAGILALNYTNSRIYQLSGGPEIAKPAGESISVLNWNIGYAGLGKDSDFVMDGGEMLRPPSREAVETNLAGIRTILANNPADIVFFQEISQPDMLTRGVDVLAGVTQALEDQKWFYSSDFRTKLIPTRWALRHGLATFTNVQTAPVQIQTMALEPDRMGGIIKRLYHMQISSLKTADGADWALINIHLSAFDEGGNIRKQQLDELIESMQALYADGKHVVIGGDFNMQLVETDFPTNTAEEFLFWRTVFPKERLPKGWQIVVDPAVPTMRSNERPYRPGENFTSIIDGFLVSPNVDVLNVRGIDTQFEYTDHQPVFAEFTAKR